MVEAFMKVFAGASNCIFLSPNLRQKYLSNDEMTPPTRNPLQSLSNFGESAKLMDNNSPELFALIGFAINGPRKLK